MSSEQDYLSDDSGVEEIDYAEWKKEQQVVGSLRKRKIEMPERDYLSDDSGVEEIDYAEWKKKEEQSRDWREECFKPLTKEEKPRVVSAFKKSDTEIVVSHENPSIEITGKVFQCLRPGGWLNNVVISVYFELLKAREMREPEKFLKCHFFGTIFYEIVGGRGSYNFESVKSWTTQEKLGYTLLECDKIFEPIHRQKNHWCLAVINNKEHKFQYLDSLNTKDDPVPFKGDDFQVLDTLARYYVDEVMDKTGKDIDVSLWAQEFLRNIPGQKNGFDCGMFMIKYVDFYCRDIGLCFSQDDMPYFRERTAMEILNGKADLGSVAPLQADMGPDSLKVGPSVSRPVRLTKRQPVWMLDYDLNL